MQLSFVLNSAVLLHNPVTFIGKNSDCPTLCCNKPVTIELQVFIVDWNNHLSFCSIIDAISPSTLTDEHLIADTCDFAILHL